MLIRLEYAKVLEYIMFNSPIEYTASQSLQRILRLKKIILHAFSFAKIIKFLHNSTEIIHSDSLKLLF